MDRSAPPRVASGMRKPLLVGSIVVHVAAFTGLAIAGAWHVDKLPVQDRGGVVAQISLPHDSGGGAAPPAAKLEPKRPPKVRPPHLVQPEIAKDLPETPAAAATDVVGTATDGPPGNGTGGDGTGTAPPTGGCATPPCTATPPAQPPLVPQPKPVVKKPAAVTITETDARALRVSGNDRIEAPATVKQEMMRDDQQRVIGTVKLCVDARGDITRASLAKSTGYAAYDDRLVDEMGAWRYQPLVKAGVATPFCTFITLVYIMK